jgi:hypothetical protein
LFLSTIELKIIFGSKQGLGRIHELLEQIGLVVNNTSIFDIKYSLLETVFSKYILLISVMSNPQMLQSSLIQLLRETKGTMDTQQQDVWVNVFSLLLESMNVESLESQAVEADRIQLMKDNNMLVVSEIIINQANEDIQSTLQRNQNLSKSTKKLIDCFRSGLVSMYKLFKQKSILIHKGVGELLLYILQKSNYRALPTTEFKTDAEVVSIIEGQTLKKSNASKLLKKLKDTDVGLKTQYISAKSYVSMLSSDQYDDTNIMCLHCLSGVDPQDQNCGCGLIQVISRERLPKTIDKPTEVVRRIVCTFSRLDPMSTTVGQTINLTRLLIKFCTLASVTLLEKLVVTQLRLPEWRNQIKQSIFLFNFCSKFTTIYNRTFDVLDTIGSSVNQTSLFVFTWLTPLCILHNDEERSIDILHQYLDVSKWIEVQMVDQTVSCSMLMTRVGEYHWDLSVAPEWLQTHASIKGLV